MRKGYAILAILALTAAMAVPASASVAWVNDPVQSIIGVTGYATNGNQMVGMSVTANFQGGGSETLAWQSLGGTLGGVSGTGWSLQVSGDTFNDNAWTLTNSGAVLASLYIDSFPGKVVFDTILDPELTPGSARGKAVFADPLAATYIGLTGIIGDASSPYGDLYRYLEIVFDPSFSQGTLTWSADTDFIGLPGTPPGTVPVPPTVWLLGSGLLGLAGLRRFRKA